MMGNSQGATFNDQMIAEFSRLSGLSENQVDWKINKMCRHDILMCQVREECEAWLYLHPDGRMKKKCFRKERSLSHFYFEPLRF